MYLALGFLLAGCATPQIDWTARIGACTFDQAVLELGPPDKQATLQDGTVVAEWITSRGFSTYTPAFGYGGYYGPYPGWHPTPAYPVYESSPDYYIRLTFGPDGKLRAWKKVVR